MVSGAFSFSKSQQKPLFQLAELAGEREREEEKKKENEERKIDALSIPKG